MNRFPICVLVREIRRKLTIVVELLQRSAALDQKWKRKSCKRVFFHSVHPDLRSGLWAPKAPGVTRRHDTAETHSAAEAASLLGSAFGSDLIHIRLPSIWPCSGLMGFITAGSRRLTKLHSVHFCRSCQRCFHWTRIRVAPGCTFSPTGAICWND